MRLFRILKGAALALTACALAACSSDGMSDEAMIAEAIDLQAQLADYRLGPADKIRVIVFGEPDLSGEFSVNARGQVSLPLLGEVEAQGLSVEELRTNITNGLSEGYVVGARVAAEVIEYRPYYILGEVEQPGEYAYSSGMSVIKAVAAAGGYTYRANKASVYIKRANNNDEMKYKLTPQLVVLPGDVVRVGERFF